MNGLPPLTLKLSTLDPGLKNLYNAVRPTVSIALSLLLITWMELGAFALCIFFAFYMMRAGAFWLVLFFTILLGLLYQMMGNYTPHVMGVRLEETLVGAAIGALVALFVFPTSTSLQIQSSAKIFMESVGTLLDDLKQTDHIDKEKLFLDLYLLEKKYFDFKKVSAPYLVRMPFVKRKITLEFLQKTNELIVDLKTLIYQALSKDFSLSGELNAKLVGKIQSKMEMLSQEDFRWRSA